MKCYPKKKKRSYAGDPQRTEWEQVVASEFADVLAGMRPVQAADGEPELTLFKTFASMCPYPDSYWVHLHSAKGRMTPT